MEHSLFIFLTTLVAAFFMAFSNGANDVSNSFATSVGAKAIQLKHALILASGVTFLGAVFLGGKVSIRLLEGIVHPQMFGSPSHYALAMLTVLLASATFILCSTLISMPVSSTHAIVGSLTGVSITAAGWHVVDWLSLSKIAISWVISPIVAGVFAYGLIVIIQRWVIGLKQCNVMTQFKVRLPLLMSFLLGGIFLLLFTQITFDTWLPMAFSPALGLTIFLMIIINFIFSKILAKWVEGHPDSPKTAERVFRRFQVGTAGYVAFAHGANDVSNSISPLYAVYIIYKHQSIPIPLVEGPMPLWILALGGLGIAGGIILLGKNVMRTLGGKITAINNSKGFGIEFSTATTVAVASALGLPISTTHATTGAIVGAGLSEGVKNIQLGMLVKILIAWIITVPGAAVIAIGIYNLLKWILF